jgi:alkylation response protein AidB-like acyl-CoA dehydrogenase
MCLETYAAESVTYRVTGLIDEVADHAKTSAEKLKAIESYRVEASIVKVYGTEVLAYCTDQAVQVFGGYGFSEEYPVARAYRDARINRIFEGTNEINRMIIPGELLKMGLKGEIPLMQAAQKLQAEMLEPSFSEDSDDTPLASETRAVEGLKKAALQVAGLAALKFGNKLNEQQEILARVADIIISSFAGESVLLRTQKMLAAGKNADLQIAMTQVLVHDLTEKCAVWGREALSSFTEGDDLRLNLAALKRLTKHDTVNVVALRRQIAAAVIAADGYIC